MKIVQRYLAISLAVCVIGALYLSFREVALPETSRIDRTLTEGEPLQEPSDRPAFTARIEGYTYTLVPRATYAISGLVVSQHRGDALFNLDHKTDPGNIRDVCVVWGESIPNGSYRKDLLLQLVGRPDARVQAGDGVEQSPPPRRSVDRGADRRDPRR